MTETPWFMVFAFANCVVTAGVLLCLLLLNSYRRRQAAFERATLAKQLSLESMCSAIQAQVSPPRQEPHEGTQMAARAGPMSAPDRSKILDNLQLGKSPEEIAVSLAIPLPAVQLVEAIARISSLPVTLDRNPASC
jgi:hypothetical protein